jgi:hypothetical protein
MTRTIAYDEAMDQVAYRAAQPVVRSSRGEGKQSKLDPAPTKRPA